MLSRWEENEEEAFRFAGLAASLRERDGFFLLGFCFRDCIGCEEDLILAKENFLIASELGHARAAEEFFDLLDESDPCCWLWWSRAALRGWAFSFLDSFSEQVELFFSGSGNSTIVFSIGHALKGNIDMEKKENFGDDYRFYSQLGPATQAVAFYDSQIESARLAVNTWSLVATRLHMIEDMRIFIGEMIWDARFEAN